jgi:hypothetical protein
MVLALVATACQPGWASHVAGTGTLADTGDGGLATNASVGYSTALLAPPGGGFYLTEAFKCVIRKVDSAGVIHRFAGTGTCGDTGDGGPATSAEIDPDVDIGGGMAVDATGDIFYVDSYAPWIREIRTDGTIVTPPWVGAYPVFAITNSADGTIYFTQTTPSSSSIPSDEIFKRVSPGGAVTSLFTAPCCYLGLTSPSAGQLVSVNTRHHVVRINESTHEITDTGAVTDTPSLVSSPNGTVYFTTSRQILRLNANNNTTVIGGNGDTGPVYGLLTPGPATGLGFQASALAYTPAGSLLFAATDAVYRLYDPGQAP